MLRNKIWSVATAILLGSGLAAAAPAPAAAPRVAPPGALQISLGDVSLNKVPFLVAADNGIYAKNGLTVHQYITPYAADKARRQGVMVPDQYVSDAGDTAHISVGGGTPMIVTYHPADLLRTPPDKAHAWQDLCFAMETMQGLQSVQTSPN